MRLIFSPDQVKEILEAWSNWEGCLYTFCNTLCEELGCCTYTIYNVVRKADYGKGRQLQWFCPKCGKGFKNQGMHFNAHIENCPGRQFYCAECEKCFTSKQNLAIHNGWKHKESK